MKILVCLLFCARLFGSDAPLEVIGNLSTARHGDDGPVAQVVKQSNDEKWTQSLEGLIISDKTILRERLLGLSKFIITFLITAYWLGVPRRMIRARSSSRVSGLERAGSAARSPRSRVRSVSRAWYQPLMDLLPAGEDKFGMFARIAIYSYVFYNLVSKSIDAVFGSKETRMEKIFDQLLQYSKQHKAIELPNVYYLKQQLKNSLSGGELLSVQEKVRFVQSMRAALLALKDQAAKDKKPLACVQFLDGAFV